MPVGPLDYKIPFDYAQRLVSTPGSPVAGIVLGLTFVITNGVGSQDFDLVMTDKVEVIDVVCQKQNGAGAGNTMQVKAGATAISDVMACAVDNTITRASTIDDAASTIAAGGTLRVTAIQAAGTRNALVTVYVLIRP